MIGTEEFKDYDALLVRLRALIRERSPAIIGIEGVMQAGKTFLAKRLAADLHIALVEVDGASHKNRNPEHFCSLPEELPYMKLIDLDLLRGDLVGALSSGSPIIVEGICLRDMLAAVSRKPDMTVYVKCLSANTGLWHVGYDIEDFESESEPFEGLYRDEMEYHSRVRPHESADLVFVRIEETHRDE